MLIDKSACPKDDLMGCWAKVNTVPGGGLWAHMWDRIKGLSTWPGQKFSSEVFCEVIESEDV